jgi:hypothetical protein
MLDGISLSSLIIQARKMNQRRYIGRSFLRSQIKLSFVINILVVRALGKHRGGYRPEELTNSDRPTDAGTD